jgi:ribosomal protein S18 acetylase RimI-like enzyme
VRIRLAGGSDRQGLLALWLDLIQHHRHLDPDYPALPGIRELLLNEIDRGLRSRSCRLGIAEEDGLPAGFVFAEIGGDERHLGASPSMAWIHELYVDPSWRRQGVGSALVGLAGQFFTERGAQLASVRVEVANPEALGFWSRLGFEERSRVLTRAASMPPDPPS